VNTDWLVFAVTQKLAGLSPHSTSSVHALPTSVVPSPLPAPSPPEPEAPVDAPPAPDSALVLLDANVGLQPIANAVATTNVAARGQRHFKTHREGSNIIKVQSK
jgi:hypothetical protein